MNKIMYFTLIIFIISKTSVLSQNLDQFNGKVYDIGCSDEDSQADLKWIYNRYKDLGNTSPPILHSDLEIYNLLKDKPFGQSFFSESHELRVEWYIFRYIPENLIIKKYNCFTVLRKAEIEWPLWQKEIHSITSINEFINMLTKYPLHGKVEIEMLQDKANLDIAEIIKKLKSCEYLIYTVKGQYSFHILKNTRENFIQAKKNPNFKRLV